MYTDAKQKHSAFTIVELLIVIVVIAILATISVVAYNGIQTRARKSALTSDLTMAAKQLRIDQTLTGSYPATVETANNGQGLKASTGTTYRYAVNNTASPQTFCLSALNGSMFYMITESSVPSEGSCVNVALGASAPNALIVDGVTTSNPYYSTGSGTLASVMVTLGSAQDISTVKVWHYYADGRTYHNSKTEVSEDGTSWTTIFDSASSGEYQETSAGKTHTFGTRKVRYIRDWVNGSTSNTSNHWVEIQAY